MWKNYEKINILVCVNSWLSIKTEELLLKITCIALNFCYRKAHKWIRRHGQKLFDVNFSYVYFKCSEIDAHYKLSRKRYFLLKLIKIYNSLIGTYNGIKKIFDAYGIPRISLIILHMLVKYFFVLGIRMLMHQFIFSFKHF